MSDFLFDLNIKNYSTDELRSMLNLEVPYNSQEIYEQSNNLKNKLLNVEDLSEKKKEDIMSFLVETRNLLVKDLDDEFEFLKKTDINSDIISVVQKSVQPGIINPIERNIIESVINFDTRFETSLTNVFDFKFPTTFQNVVSIKVHSLELPNFLYNISSVFKNNSFDISAAGTKSTITIPDGKYSKNDLSSAIQTQLVIVNGNFTCSINSITGLTTIANTDNFDLLFKTTNKINLGKMLGYKKDFLNTTSAQSSNCADVDLLKYYYLSVNDFQQSMDNNVLPFLKNDFVSNNILAKAQSKDDENNNLYLKRNYFGPITLEKIRFSLLDHYGEILDLNGIDYSFSLVVERLYRF
jgi:hypothetical protein